MSDWQPIETAPKDGTRILIFDPEEGVNQVQFSELHDGWFDAYGIREDPWEGNKFHPTHWMPLPRFVAMAQST